MAIKSSNRLQQQFPNKYRDIKGYLGSDNPITLRALFKVTPELLELPANATLIDPTKIGNEDLLNKAVKVYNNGGINKSLNITKKSINDCYTVLINDNESQEMIGAITFAPFEVDESELLVYITPIKVKESHEKKGYGTALLNIVKNFTLKCSQKGVYNQVNLLLSASTHFRQHQFFSNRGYQMVTDPNLITLTQSESTLMYLDMGGQKSGTQKLNQWVINIQKNNQNTVATAITDTIQHDTPSNTIKDQNKSEGEHEGMVSRVEETKQAIDGQNKHQPDHLFDNIPHTTSNGMNNNNEFQEFKLPLNKRNLKILDKEAPSDIGSKVSMASNKTSGGHVKRHCELCGFKHIADWVKHKKKVHGGIEVSSVKCLPECSYCTGQQQQQQQQNLQQSKSEHKMGQCNNCGGARQVRYLSNGLCATCIKKTGCVSKSAINVPLDISQMIDFSDDQQVDPDDSISMVGNKRLAQKSLDFKEIEYEAGAIDHDNLQEQVSSPIATRQVQDTQTYSVLDMSAINTDMAVTSLLTALEAIENSTVPDFQASLKVSVICEQFVHQQALTLLKKDSYPRLASLITKILNEQAGELQQQQLAGLFVAACKLQGPCWTAAVIMLQRRKSDIQQYVLKVFNSHIEVTYGTDVAQWINGHWRNVQDQQLDIMKQLKGVQSPVDILFLSLAVQVDNVPEFIEYSTLMLQRDVSVYMLESICKRLTQQRLSVQQFLELCELVQLDNVKSIIQNNSDIFKSTLLWQWTSKVEELKAISHLMNAESVQEAVGEYLQVYGDVDAAFTEDMFSEDTLLGLAMHESFNKPNAKQLGLAQYCVGKIRQCQRQLWSVPSGQGKSRIIAFAAAIAYETGMFSAVHISYDNEALLKRDKHDFESLWIVLGCVDKIHYHVGCDFPTQEGELVIVDESDTVTLNTPDVFIKLVNGRACICFTATPDNCDGKGVEAKVISALKLEVFHYVPDAEVVDAATRLKTDHTQHADSIETKVSYIQSLVANGPVLIYGTVQLKEALTAVADLITVDPQVDYSMLRKLDQAPYKVLFADTQFGMRGIDYRCERVTMHLVIAQPFSCTREALQGVARVGRFGDHCKRIIFDGVELVDKMQQLQYSSKLMRYAATAKVNIKQVKVKQAAAPQQRNTGAGNLAKRQVQAAQIELQKQQQQQKQQTIKDFITTNKNK